jgi:hypothetical protein
VNSRIHVAVRTFFPVTGTQPCGSGLAIDGTAQFTARNELCGCARGTCGNPRLSRGPHDGRERPLERFPFSEALLEDGPTDSDFTSDAAAGWTLARMGVTAVRPKVMFRPARTSGFWKVQHSPVAVMKTVHIK